MLLALFQTVCVKNVICVVSQWACAISELVSGVGVLDGEGCGDPIGKVHKSVVLSFPPSNMILLSYLTVHLCLLRCTSQPTSVNTWILNRDMIDRSGIICPVRTVGRPTMCTLHS